MRNIGAILVFWEKKNADKISSILHMYQVVSCLGRDMGLAPGGVGDLEVRLMVNIGTT